MTRETKLGIAMVLLLGGVFGFLVYKRSLQQADGIAQTEPATPDDDGAVEGDNISLTPASEFPPRGEDGPEILPVANHTRPIPQEEPGDVDDPFGGAEQAPVRAANTRPRLPTMIPDDEPAASIGGNEFLADPRETASSEPDIDANDPFEGGGTVATERTRPSQPIRTAPTLEFAAEESNGFAVEEVEEEMEEPVARPPVRQPEFREPASRTFEPLDDEPTVSLQARGKIPEEAFEFEEPEPQNPVEVIEPRRTAVEPAAPQLMLDDSEEDRYGGYQPIELVEAVIETPFAAATARGEAPRRVPDSFDAFETPGDQRKHAVTIAGDRYVVQPGDNFWSISQKKYGTGRYFQALAAHNHGRIPDPNKMKPGVEISLPTSHELDRRYATLIQPSGGAESPDAGSPAAASGEFLIGSDGHPRYKVGPGDTLSGIAQKYLGRAQRWGQIQQMNRDVLKDGTNLKVGAVLRLPSDAAQLQLTNQPRYVR